jgi:type I restriction enzyme S subunit
MHDQNSRAKRVNPVEFGTLFHFIRNGMNVKQDKSGDGLPITRIETISDATVDASRVGYAGLKESECSDWLLEPGDILFSHINSVEHIGKCAVYRGVPEKLIHGMNLLCFRCDTSKLLPEFGKYLIRGIEFRTRLSNFINKAVNQASVSIGNLKTIPVTVPPLAEQQRIVEVLDRAEYLRAKRRAALAQIDALSKSLFLDLFGNPATNLERWSACTLGDALAAIRSGVNAEQLTNPGGWPITRIETISDGTIDIERVRWIEPDPSLLGDFQLHPGDILFSHINSVEHIGKTAIYSGTPTPLIHGINLLRLRPKLDTVEPVWLLHLLKNDAVRAVFRNRCKRAVNQASLNQQDVKSLAISLPPISLQQNFARRLRVVEQLKDTHEASLGELDALFAALQCSAFNGEL